jgi:hypothetical protein
MARLRTSATGTPAFWASWVSARFSVEARHGEPAVGGDLRRVLLGDEAVGVAGVADHEHAYVIRCVAGDGLALGFEDAAVDVEQVATLHAGLAGDRADEQGPGRAVEGHVEVSCALDAGEQREGAVVELHDDALEGLHAGLDLEQAQDDGSSETKELARGDAEERAG